MVSNFCWNSVWKNWFVWFFWQFRNNYCWVSCEPVSSWNVKVISAYDEVHWFTLEDCCSSTIVGILRTRCSIWVNRIPTFICDFTSCWVYCWVTVKAWTVSHKFVIVCCISITIFMQSDRWTRNLNVFITIQTNFFNVVSKLSVPVVKWWDTQNWTIFRQIKWCHWWLRIKEVQVHLNVKFFVSVVSLWTNEKCLSWIVVQLNNGWTICTWCFYQSVSCNDFLNWSTIEWCSV